MKNLDPHFDYNSLDDGGSVWIGNTKLTHDNIGSFELKLIHESSVADVYQHSEDSPFIIVIKSLKFFQGCAYEGSIKVDWFHLELNEIKRRIQEI